MIFMTFQKSTLDLKSLNICRHIDLLPEFKIMHFDGSWIFKKCALPPAHNFLAIVEIEITFNHQPVLCSLPPLANRKNEEIVCQENRLKTKVQYLNVSCALILKWKKDIKLFFAENLKHNIKESLWQKLKVVRMKWKIFRNTCLAGSLQLRQLAAALWQSSHHHCFGVTIIAMMISDTAVTMMMMVLVVMVMMMTVDRWQRVPMVGGFRGNGAHSSRPAPLCPFLRHYSPVRSPFFAPAGRSVPLDFCRETIFRFQIWCTLTSGFLP